jgi:hypothetical protein
MKKDDTNFDKFLDQILGWMVVCLAIGFIAFLCMAAGFIYGSE